MIDAFETRQQNLMTRQAVVLKSKPAAMTRTNQALGMTHGCTARAIWSFEHPTFANPWPKRWLPRPVRSGLFQRIARQVDSENASHAQYVANAQSAAVGFDTFSRNGQP